MIAVDTNILVRLLTRDDEQQFQRSYQLFQQNQIYVATTVVLECEWVLRYAYKCSPAEIIVGFCALFGLENVNLENGERIALALTWHEQGLVFADALHLAASPEEANFYTFDHKLIKASENLSCQQARVPT